MFSQDDVKLIIERLEAGIIIPDKVVVGSDGFACKPSYAEKKYLVRAEVAFIRNDGWILGAPLRFAKVAHSLWKDWWVGATLKLPKGVPLPSLN